MPFMKGPAPIRRTVKYLTEGCGLYLRDRIKIFTINYNISGERHDGARAFVFWHVPQIQYANPDVQVVTFKNMTPTPFVRCFMDDGKQMLIDVDNKSKEEILSHLIRVIGKPKHKLDAETLAREKKDNPANFGIGCERACICEIRGQVPCSGVLILPPHMRGKTSFAAMK